MGAWLAAHKKAIAGAVGGAVAAGLGAFSQGGDWRAIVAAAVVGALGVGGTVSWSPANRPRAAA